MPHTPIKQRNVTWIWCSGRLQETFHRLRPLSLLFRRHSIKIVREDGRGGKSLDNSKIANRPGYLSVGCVADYYHVLRKFKAPSSGLPFPAFKLESEPARVRNEMISSAAVQPDFPRIRCTVVCGKPRCGTSPKCAQSCLDDGPYTLHKIGILRPAFRGVFVLKGFDLFPQIGHPAGDAKTVARAGAAPFSAAASTLRRCKPLESRLLVTNGSFGLASISR